MGVWGPRAFENDEALDWVYEFEESGAEAASSALAVALSHGTDDYLEASDGARAIAASEVVAAAHGSPAGSLPEAVERVLARQAGAITRRIEDARGTATRAVRRVAAANSELAEGWLDESDLAAWRVEIDDLLRRLAS